MSDQYRMHRLQPGDEWVLGTLAQGNARFGDGSEKEWQPPLGSDEASQFVSDPNTICIVAIDNDTNHIGGFIYGGVLLRRHTRLRHVCIYELGVDLDHRDADVAFELLTAFGAECRRLHIDRAFSILTDAQPDVLRVFERYGAVRGDGRDALFGLEF